MIWPFENDTSAVIKNMAQKSIAFDKKKNLFCISAIVVAVAMIMMSLLTVQNIIHQNQNEVSGLHQGIFFDITQKDKGKKQYRAFKLEGYLFPDTYEFYKNMKPQDAVGKFLRGSKSVLACLLYTSRCV